MRIVEWDYQRLLQLTMKYEKKIRIVVEDIEGNLFVAKIVQINSDDDSKIKFRFDTAKDFEIKALPKGYKLFLIYNESVEEMYRIDQQKIKEKRKRIMDEKSLINSQKDGRCIKCDGSGYLSEYNHIQKGISFHCNGQGYI